jgi:glycosyltransferase involved in cell wall biosynthesis
MNILFLHQNFPAQFIHVASALQRGGHRVMAVVPETNNRPRIVPTETYRFEPPTHVPSSDLGAHYRERAMRGSAAADGMLRLKASGFTPDVVVGHGGWGETLFVRDIWPRARLIVHAEFYYTADSADVGFDPEFETLPTLTQAIRLRVRNSAMIQAIVDADVAVAPTQWQAGRFPPSLRQRLTILHEGINTTRAAPNPRAEVRLGRDKLTLRPGDEIITFVNRNLEPYRGYHSFLRALPDVLRARPKARAVIVGGDSVSYGPALPNGQSWKNHYLEEVRDKLDMSRIHFVGMIPHNVFVQLMQVSAAHVYLTYPFVLSWSALEAMSAGAVVIGSRTPPVEEVIEDGVHGHLVDFFDTAVLSERIIDVLASPAAQMALRRAARQTVIDRFDLHGRCLPQWLALVRGEADGGEPFAHGAPALLPALLEGTPVCGNA